MAKIYDFMCKECNHEEKDVMCNSHKDKCACPKCGKDMEKDYSNFKGMHTDSVHRTSAVRGKGKYKYDPAEKVRPRRRPAIRKKGDGNANSKKN
jgi:putative FmdB family regulatory protein